MTPEEIANSLDAMLERRRADGGSHAPLMEGEKYALSEAIRTLRARHLPAAMCPLFKCRDEATCFNPANCRSASR